MVWGKLCGSTLAVWYGGALCLAVYTVAKPDGDVLFWCGIGNYRLMAQELRIRTLPWVWGAFIAFLILYMGGFIMSSADYGYYFGFMALCLCVALTYAGVLTEQNDPMRIKRLILYAGQQNWRRMAEELPLWCISLSVALPSALLFSVIPPPLNAAADEFYLYPLPIVLLLLRDIAIYLFFSYGKKPQRALMLTLLAAVLLYGLLPGIFLAVQQDAAAALFFPLWAGNAALATVFSAVQAGAVLIILYKRWQRRVYGHRSATA